MFRRDLVWAALVLFTYQAFPSLVAAQTQPRSPRPTQPPTDADAKQSAASGTQGAVSAGGMEAVRAGITILKQGGNAADAAVATILAECVTDAQSVCFGGEVPILVYNAQRKSVESIAGQGAAPRLATLEHFRTRGGIPLSGIESAAVPGLLDACLVTLERHGRKSFREVVQPTLDLLSRREQPWHANLEKTLQTLIAAEQTTTDRIQGLRRVSDAFYRGPIARQIDDWSRASGGLIRFHDLAAHTTRVEDPVLATYRGLTVAKCGVWTQGPALLETLQILEGFDLSSRPLASPESVHLAVEAMKLALADRDQYYADPLFASVPLEQLLAPTYATQRRALVDPSRASLERRPGDPRTASAQVPPAEIPPQPDAISSDTTTCVVADAEGNVVVATPSGWSGVLAGETGVWLGSRLQSFNTVESHPNVIEPGKRPRITLTPTLVLHDGRPIIGISVAGGDLQDQVALQVLLELVDRKATASASVTSPRWSTDHHVGSFGQKPPVLGSLTLDAKFPETVKADLESRGHRVGATRGAIAAPSVLTIDPATGQIDVAGDPAAGRHSAAY